MVNSIYGKLLRYSVPLHIDPKSKSFRLVTKNRELTAFYLFLVVSALIIACLTDGMVEGMLIGSSKASFIIFVLSFLAFCAILAMFWAVFIIQYFNSIVQLDRKHLRKHWNKIYRIYSVKLSHWIDTGNLKQQSKIYQIIFLSYFHNFVLNFCCRITHYAPRREIWRVWSFYGPCAMLFVLIGIGWIPLAILIELDPLFLVIITHLTELLQNM